MWRGAVLGTVLLASCGARTGMTVDEMADAGALDAPTRPDTPADAPLGPLACRRELHLRFTPTARVQLAAWIDGGDRFATIALTAATARHGIGNRPARSS